MNKIKDFIIIIFITLIFFIILNIFLSISWKFYNDLKYKNYNPFAEIVRNNFEISEKDQSLLHKNTYDLQFKFKAFVGPLPKNYKSKFVNFDENLGRFVNNPNNCEKKTFFSQVNVSSRLLGVE